MQVRREWLVLKPVINISPLHPASHTPSSASSLAQHRLIFIALKWWRYLKWSQGSQSNHLSTHTAKLFSSLANCRWTQQQSRSYYSFQGFSCVCGVGQVCILKEISVQRLTVRGERTASSAATRAAWFRRVRCDLELQPSPAAPQPFRVWLGDAALCCDRRPCPFQFKCFLWKVTVPLEESLFLQAFCFCVTVLYMNHIKQRVKLNYIMCDPNTKVQIRFSLNIAFWLYSW